MCRLYGFLANEDTKVECTLVYAQNALLQQSREDLTGHSHTDGWGICCYQDGIPTCERRPTAAHQDVWFGTTAQRIYSKAVLAHVRRATVGGPSLENTHPFVHGCWSFVHNGTLMHSKQLEAQLLQEIDPQLARLRRGTTDSELIFFWLLTRMAAEGCAWDRRCEDSTRLQQVVSFAVQELAARSGEDRLDQPSQLNVLLTDGHCLVATRWNRSLHLVERTGLHDCEICGIPHVQHDPRTAYRACVIASEPISHEQWSEVPNHSVIAIDSELHVEQTPITCQ